jgi:hypothetical protein
MKNSLKVNAESVVCLFPGAAIMGSMRAHLAGI